jgi:hypothetical protein
MDDKEIPMPMLTSEAINEALEPQHKPARRRRTVSPTTSRVAGLSNHDISAMRREELLEVIRAARLPVVDDEDFRHVVYADREALERLAFLARRCCRNQMLYH